MKRLPRSGLLLTLLLCALLTLSCGGGGRASANTLDVTPRAGATKEQPDTVRLTPYPIWTLAMDWPRVAYASGKEGNTMAIHVWNLVTGASSVVKSPHDFAVHHTAAIAIAGGRLAWVRSLQLGNTELDHWLYTAPLGGSAHLIRYRPGYADTGCGVGGPQIGGLVGSGKTLAVSTWTVNEDHSSSAQQLDLITPTALRTIATGGGAIVSESADGGHIAVLPLATQNVIPDGCTAPTPPSSVAVYSTNGTVLSTIQLGTPGPRTFGTQVALSGRKLVVLTAAVPESGPASVSLAVYDWTTGVLLHRWPVAIKNDVGEVNLAVYGRLAAVEGPFRLRLVDLSTGKDISIAPASGTVSPTAIGPRGLIYAVNPHNTGKLVFVPTAKLLALLKG